MSLTTLCNGSGQRREGVHTAVEKLQAASQLVDRAGCRGYSNCRPTAVCSDIARQYREHICVCAEGLSEQKHVSMPRVTQ